MNVTINGKKGYCNPEYNGHGDGTYTVCMEDNTIYFATDEELGLVPEQPEPIVVDGMGYEWVIPSSFVNIVDLAEVRNLFDKKAPFRRIRLFFKRNGIECISEHGQKNIHHYHLMAALNSIDIKLSELIYN